MGGNEVTDFRSQVGRWYDRTGGLDQEVDSSQQSLQQYGSPFGRYGKWDPANVDMPIFVEEAGLPERTRGRYESSTGSILVPTGKKAGGGTMEHEATHATMLTAGYDPKALRRRLDAGNQPLWRDTGTQGADDEILEMASTDAVEPYAQTLVDRGMKPTDARQEAFGASLGADNQYLARRVEVDPRIAEVRRRYAAYTGNRVTNPEEAQGAWDWWKNDGLRLDQWAAPGNRASMDAYATSLYDAMPEPAKQAMFVRMTQVPTILAPLMGAAAGQQSQRTDSTMQPVLGGLMR
jgi:hypothetical protein